MSDTNPIQPELDEIQGSNLSLQSKQDLISWRRAQALTMYAAGKTMTEIAEVLKVDVSTISRDIAYIRQESKERQSEYIESELPFRHALRVANMDKA
ncbi:MAG: helix-turn-helix domain-containing protein, partial [Nitrososphaera sp.]